MSAHRIAIGAIAALALGMSVAGAATRDDFLYGNADDGSNLPFRYFVPPGYDGTSPTPLILFLHGAGERGSDNEAQLNNDANGAMRLVDDVNLDLQPVFMIAPQCPTGGWWSGATLASAVGIVDQIAATYNIDPDRVYVTGLSMGGMGTWSAVTAEPGRFAAAVPMSGNGDTNPAGSVASIPFWFFHAANDGTVGVEGSDNLVAALRNAGGNVIYTRYDTGGHGIWPVAYAHPLLFAWIVSQVRGAPSTIAPPVLHIELPTDQPAWTTEDATVSVAGTASADTYPVDAVTWDLLGGTGGDASGTDDWSVLDIPLADGANLIRVTATAPTGYDPYGGLMTFNDALRVSRMGPPPPPGTIVAAINAGGAAYTAGDGTPYAADTAFDGGSTQVSNVDLPNTDDDALYNDWRYGNFAYHLPVYPGEYAVELHFADTYNTAPGQRIFDVAIEGATVLDDFDIIATAGANTALVRTFDVDVVDGVLDIALTNGSVGNARLDAFRVIRAGGEGPDSIFADGFE
ncbi:MAG TPA: malectin domain-containing carbohydrate-binding protein [Rhodanobacteraceae bacterium]|nr:malectin domain-containing carbohydrate-binding protein [Rhodanobacteraceae bacterium]